MALPDSRNETYSVGTAVEPDTLNDLQDGQIALKHGDLELYVGATEFISDPQSANEPLLHIPATAPTSWRGVVGGVTNLKCELTLPEGTVVKRLELFCEDDGVNRVNLFVLANPMALSGGSYGVFTGGNSKNSAGALGLKTIVFDETDTDDGNGYTLPFTYVTNTLLTLNVTLPAVVACRIRGAKVRINKPN